MPLDRRTFLKGSAAVAGPARRHRAVIDRPVKAGRDYDVARSLPVDRVVRTTCSPNCTGSCGQLAFVRDGIIVKIQQAADYPDTVYNPRGCMKGLSYVNHVYGEDRIAKPMIRTGERGSGEFREATWDEALDRIAAGLKAIGEKWGWDSIHVFGQVPGSGYIQKGANYRASALLGMTHGTSFDFNGDLPMGMPITRRPERRARARLGEQPVPAAPGLEPGRDRSPTSTSSSTRWRPGPAVVVDPLADCREGGQLLQIRPGTDAALGLALVARSSPTGWSTSSSCAPTPTGPCS